MKALVIGLGKAGISAGRYLQAKGWTVTGCDRKPAPPEAAVSGIHGSLRELNGSADLNESGSGNLRRWFESIAWGSEDPALLAGIDLVVPSPGIPPANPIVLKAMEAGIPVKGEAALGLEGISCPVVAITGTNGKTTTTHLAGELFSACGFRTAICGNNGFPVTEAFGPGGNEWDLAVVEMSSFMIDRKGGFVPRAAAILNMTPDHLDRYADTGEYYSSKMAIAEGMGPGNALIVNADCRETMSRAGKLSAAGWRGRLLTFSRLDPSADCHADGSMVRLALGGRRMDLDISARSLKGDHNVENILAAVLVGAEMGLDAEGMESGIKGFSPVEHRIEPVRELDGIAFINDSKGTNPDSTIKAIGSFEGHLSLILGGYDKGSDFDDLARVIVSRGAVSVVLMGQTAPRISQALAAAGYGHSVTIAGDLEDAVGKARDMAARAVSSGGTVLFSPACASYDMFRNFEERGKMFKTIVRSLK